MPRPRLLAAVNIGGKAASILVLLGLTLLYYRSEWPTLQAFVEAMDWGRVLFFDFIGIYAPTGLQLFHDPAPATDFFYGPFAALLFLLGEPGNGRHRPANLGVLSAGLNDWLVRGYYAWLLAAKITPAATGRHGVHNLLAHVA